MSTSETPFAYLHFAVLGLLAGLGIALGGGMLLHEQWKRGPSRSAGQITVQGVIADARWRRSAVPDGPNRYLQVRIEGDDRRFLISARDLSEAKLDALGRSGEREGAISALNGRKSVVLLDSALRDDPTPYLSALWIEERLVGSQERAAAHSLQWGFVLLFGGGALMGVALMSVSVHHLVVCLRYWRRYS